MKVFTISVSENYVGSKYVENGLKVIFEERLRQLHKEKHYLMDDVLYNTENQLTLAASAYALPQLVKGDDSFREDLWPWSGDTWKPTPDDRIRELAKAGALIAAEISRLLYIQDDNREAGDNQRDNEDSVSKTSD